MIPNKQQLGNLLITRFLDFIHCPAFEETLKNITFRKLDLFPSSVKGWETLTLLCLLERSNFNHLSDTGRWTKSENPVIASVIHHGQNHLVSARNVSVQRGLRYDDFVSYRKLKIESSGFRMLM
jgi:hypothetical protein